MASLFEKLVEQQRQNSKMYMQTAWGFTLPLLVVIYLAVKLTMIITGRVSEQENAFQAKKHELEMRMQHSQGQQSDVGVKK